MQITHCDLCKRPLEAESISVSYHNEDTHAYQRHDACGNCARPIIAFLEDHGWTEYQKNSFEIALAKRKELADQSTASVPNSQ